MYFEFCTKTNDQQDPQWFAVHTGGQAKTGILCLIRKGLVPEDHVRYVALIPGRLLHIRLLFNTPLDLLCVYQTAWNPSHSALANTNKTEALLRQLAKLWRQMEKWLAQIPLRHGTLLIGDMNTPLRPDHPTCGPGTTPCSGCPQRDQDLFQDMLSRMGLPSTQYMDSTRSGCENLPTPVCE